MDEGIEWRSSMTKGEIFIILSHYNLSIHSVVQQIFPLLELLRILPLHYPLLFILQSSNFPTEIPWIFSVLFHFVRRVEAIVRELQWVTPIYHKYCCLSNNIEMEREDNYLFPWNFSLFSASRLFFYSHSSINSEYFISSYLDSSLFNSFHSRFWFWSSLFFCPSFSSVHFSSLYSFIILSFTSLLLSSYLSYFLNSCCIFRAFNLRPQIISIISLISSYWLVTCSSLSTFLFQWSLFSHNKHL